MWGSLLQYWNYQGTHLKTKLKYWFRNNQWLRSQALIETLINYSGTETSQQWLHVNVIDSWFKKNDCMLIQKFPQWQWAQIQSPYSIKNKDAQFWDTTKYNELYALYLYILHISHTNCSILWVHFVSIFDHLINIICRIVYQQAHYHWLSLFALCSVSIDQSFQILCLPSLGYYDLVRISLAFYR